MMLCLEMELLTGWQSILWFQPAGIQYLFEHRDNHTAYCFQHISFPLDSHTSARVTQQSCAICAL